jgi:hypothetical protein
MVMITFIGWILYDWRCLVDDSFILPSIHHYIAPALTYFDTIIYWDSIVRPGASRSRLGKRYDTLQSGSPPDRQSNLAAILVRTFSVYPRRGFGVALTYRLNSSERYRE